MSVPETWLEVRAVLDSEPEDWARLAEVFDRHGIEGTVQTDYPLSIAGYASPLGDTDIESLKAELVRLGAGSVQTRTVASEDWAEAWKQFFHPMRLGHRFVVRPTWEKAELGADDVEIVLDPGQAFGTGEHPTTRLCALMLEEHGCSEQVVADIGCGSGILCIVAAKLGAASVIGVDVDPLAIEVALENCSQNAVEAFLCVGEGFVSTDAPDGSLDGPFDLVVSNIISSAIINLAPEAHSRIRPGGTWIVSGIVDENWPDVQQRVEQVGFAVDVISRESGWVAAILLR